MMREMQTGIYVQFIRCTLCGYEMVLPGVTSPEVEKVKRQVVKMSERAQHEIDRYGVISGSTNQSLRRLKKRRDTLLGELYAKAKEEPANTAGAD
jgi:hypothetical protein